MSRKKKMTGAGGSIARDSGGNIEGKRKAIKIAEGKTLPISIDEQAGKWRRGQKRRWEAAWVGWWNSAINMLTIELFID